MLYILCGIINCLVMWLFDKFTKEKLWVFWMIFLKNTRRIILQH